MSPHTRLVLSINTPWWAADAAHHGQFYTCHARLCMVAHPAYRDTLLVGVCGNPILERIVDRARQSRSAVLRRGTSRMNTADIDAAAIGDTASALPVCRVDGIAQPVRTAGRYRSRHRPHRAKSLVTRVASNRMRPASEYAPARIPTMRRRAQHDQRIVVIAIRARYAMRKG